MKRFWTSTLLLGLLAPLYTTCSAGWAQDADNEKIAAARKAALVVDVRGVAPVKPDVFWLQVEVSAEGKGRAVVRTDYGHSVEKLRAALQTAGFAPKGGEIAQVLIPNRDGGYYVVSATEPGIPNEAVKVVGFLTFSASTPDKVQAAFAAMRATGATGNVTVNHSLSDDELARRAALQAAVAMAKRRLQILSEAAKPKTFDLLYIKEGEFQPPTQTSVAPLQGKDPLVLLPTINAEETVTFFYGFKAVAKPALKPVKKP